MATNLTPEQLKLYFSGKYFHPNYEETVEMAEAIRVHADGTYPEELIEERRPSESEAVKEYRSKIWQPITKPYMSKVFTSLNKIRRSTEWSVKFDNKAVPSRIMEADSLDYYLTYEFPYFESITNWAFGLLLREQCIDPNAWIVVMPINREADQNQYQEPFPFIFRSDQIIEPAEGDHLVILSDEKVIFTQDKEVVYGDRYLVVTDTSIQQWDQKTKERRFEMTWEFPHDIGEMPAFKLKALVKKSHGKYFLHESRIASMIIRFNEALREYSDLQAEVVQHIFSEKWEMATGPDCTTCKGTGVVTHAGYNRGPSPCGTCHGTCKQPRGPYSTLIVTGNMAGESAPVTPPMGYVQKTTDIVKIQDERIDKHIYSGLASINMEFLAMRPLNESGVAKAYDADETNNFAHSIAEDLVAILDQVCYFCNEIRYGIVVPNAEARDAMLPSIAVPDRFDLFSAKMIEEEIATAKTNKVNPLLINAMELEYAQRKFSNDPAVRDRLSLTLTLDPLPNISQDDKMVMLSNKGITQESYIISCNILAFVDRAIEENGIEFYSLEPKEQKLIMVEYAKEQITGSSVVANLIVDNVGG